MEHSSPERPGQPQPRDADASESPHEPPRHAQSNNWRVRTSDNPPPVSNPSRGARRDPDSAASCFGSDSWRTRSTQNPDTSSPRDARSHGASPSWRGHQQDNQAIPQDRVRDRETNKPSSNLKDDASDAPSEGRRIYLGNIFYNVRPEEIREASQSSGFPDIENIHISVDPVTGRNPGYCFVEFATREMANAAIEGMSGVHIKGRPLKTGPSQNKRPTRSDERRRGGGGGGYTPTFARWGDWKPEGNGVRLDGQGPVGAEEHLIDVVQHQQRSRVFVGGLGRMINQEHNDQELREIFKDFKVVAVGKRITPHPSTQTLPGKHHYAFVDLGTEEEALAAVKALNGRSWTESRLKVRVQSELPQEIEERGRRYNPNDTTIPKLHSSAEESE
ncbi:hypothetical protein ACO1O0_008287 [Amphichorda felina]